MMMLEELTIGYKHKYSKPDPIKNPMIAVVKFKGEKHTTTIAVDDEITRHIIVLCADELVKAAQIIAKDITRETIEAVAATPKLDKGKDDE